MISYASRVTTVVTSAGTIHAYDTGALRRAVCGVALSSHAVPLRSSPTADAYVTCNRCRARLDQGITVSAATVRRAVLASVLSDPNNH